MKTAKPRIELPAALAALLRAEARRAAPQECCGLLEGTRTPDGFIIQALHPARNLADDPDRFAIDPRDHFSAVRAARAHGRAIIGCYHSHPRGPAEPSMSDVAGAEEDNFLWLIAAGETVNAFVYFRSGFLGADCVTSSE